MMPAFPLPAVHCKRERCVEGLHELPEIGMSGLQLEMIVIGHQAIRVDGDAADIRIFGKFFKKKQVVIFRIENLFPAVPTVDYMVRSSWVFDP